MAEFHPICGYDMMERQHQTSEVVMIYRGTVRDGVVVLPPDVQLPDGLHVIVEPIQSRSSRTVPANWQGTLRNGVPVFPPGKVGTAPDLDLVNELRDETP